MKINIILSFLCLVLSVSTLMAQDRLISKNNYAKFYSHAPLEDITAENHQVSSVIDIDKKEMVVKMLMKHFRFENALMEEHFNENYVESEVYPSAVFKGMYSIDRDIDLFQDSEYTLEVSGLMKIHGVERQVETTASLRVEDRKLRGTTQFIVKPKDYQIEIPSVVVKNIAEEIEVTVELSFDIKMN